MEKLTDNYYYDDGNYKRYPMQCEHVHYHDE